ncbi:MAG: DMT family transporter [Oscillospiraceae bacterium]|nr:DMT family transporter [Oscillospiraceae bacterium]
MINNSNLSNNIKVKEKRSAKTKPNKKINSSAATLMLLLAAIIWGSGFSAQRAGMERLGPMTFAAVRFCVAAVALTIPVMIFRRRLRGGLKTALRETLGGGFICGFLLFAASLAQQIGLVHATSGKAGFITALYIVLTPIAGMLIGKRTGRFVWVAVGFALAGMALMCIEPGFTIRQEDRWLMLCALIFTAQILAVDKYAPRSDGMLLSWIQVSVCAFFSVISMFIWEDPIGQAASRDIFSSWLPIMYAGVMSCAAAYTLQIYGQRGAHPTLASLMMSLEAVFAALFGWIILGEQMTGRQSIGAVILFAATAAAALAGKPK